MPENKDSENTTNLDISISKIPLPPTPCKEILSDLSDSVIIIEDNSILQENVNCSMSDSVIILDEPPAREDNLEKEHIPINSQTSSGKSEPKQAEEIMVTGVCVHKAANYPHARQDCFLHHFNPAVRTYSDIQREKGAFETNKVYCDKCFCYLCDTEASKCTQWKNSTFPHCCAHRKSNYWREKRWNFQKRK